MESDRRRQLPSVEWLLAAIRREAPATPHALALAAAREAVEAARAGPAGGQAWPRAEVLARARKNVLAGRSPSLRPVINASGVLLQTNLGRAPLGERAIAAMVEVARGYSNLEFDLETGARGSRHEHVRGLLRQTTGAEDGLVVNNNAAALLMVLQVLAGGREVVVSRGQAVEIGGGFRIPDVLRQSGARLVEVGTTNRTYARDYREALSPETAAILRVHTSNFKVVGFATEPSAAELAAVARDSGVLLLDDLGSGCLVDTTAYGLGREPTVQASLGGGADLAMFSGDKLLGGPQCGLIVGRGELVERLRRHPLARALRVDKLTIAALTATLASYAEGREREEVPLWRMLAEPVASLRRRAVRLARAAGEGARVVQSRTLVGGGSLPGEGVDSWCVSIGPAGGAERLAAALRASAPAVVGRIEQDQLLLDLRTVLPNEDEALAEALRRALAMKLT